VDAGGEPPRLILLGPPNSGKGTQAKKVSARLGVPAISTGDMLRRAVAEGSELGKRVESTLAAGRLVDDETMAKLVEERLSCEDAEDGFLLDGYPRTLGQARTLDRILEECGERLDAAILIRVPEEELVRRGLDRGRDDDDEAVLRERLKVYGEDTEPLVGYYGESGLLLEVDGHRPIDEVTSCIFAKLGVESPTGA
jgi:adenylate kinase